VHVADTGLWCRYKQVYFFKESTGESVWERPTEGTVIDLPEECNPEKVACTEKDVEEEFHNLWHDVYIIGLEDEEPAVCNAELLKRLKDMVDAITEQFMLISSSLETYDMNEYICNVWHLGHRMRDFPDASVRFDIIVSNGMVKIVRKISNAIVVMGEMIKKSIVMEKAKEYTRRFTEDVDVGCKRSRE